MNDNILIDFEKYKMLFNKMLNAFSLHEIVLDSENNPVDYIFLDVNPAFEKMTGLVREDIINKKVTEVLPGTEIDPANWIGKYGKVAQTGKEIRFENYSEGLKKWYSVYAFSPQKNQFATIFEDITQKKESEVRLKENEEKYRLYFNLAPVG